MKLTFDKIIIGILVVLSTFLTYNLNKANAVNKAMLRTIEGQKEEIKDLNSVITKINEELYKYMSKQEEQKHVQEDIKQAEAHLGDNFYWVDVTCTAYSAGDGLTPSTTMANGEEVYVGAVAYNDVPLGTRIEIDGMIYTVCDRVGSDGVVDIYMNTIDECFEFGVQDKRIKVYYE